MSGKDDGGAAGREAPYRAKSLTGAEREVRRLRRMVTFYHRLSEGLLRERLQVARLAAKSPQFFNPILVMEAERVRDRILASPNSYPPEMRQ